nr:MAG TPA: hypothetical protein [Caudoviricetes sp.]
MLEVTGGANAGKWRKRRCKEVSDSGKGIRGQGEKHRQPGCKGTVSARKQGQRQGAHRKRPAEHGRRKKVKKSGG